MSHILYFLLVLVAWFALTPSITHTRAHTHAHTACGADCSVTQMGDVALGCSSFSSLTLFGSNITSLLALRSETNLTTIGALTVDSTSLVSLAGLEHVLRLDTIAATNNPLLATLAGLDAIIGYPPNFFYAPDIQITNNQQLRVAQLTCLQAVDVLVEITDNPALKTLSLLGSYYVFNISIERNSALTNVTMPSGIGLDPKGTISFANLDSLVDLRLPTIGVSSTTSHARVFVRNNPRMASIYGSFFGLEQLIIDNNANLTRLNLVGGISEECDVQMMTIAHNPSLKSLAGVSCVVWSTLTISNNAALRSLDIVFPKQDLVTPPFFPASVYIESNPVLASLSGLGLSCCDRPGVGLVLSDLPLLQSLKGMAAFPQMQGYETCSLSAC